MLYLPIKKTYISFAIICLLSNSLTSLNASSDNSSSTKELAIKIEEQLNNIIPLLDSEKRADLEKTLQDIKENGLNTETKRDLLKFIKNWETLEAPHTIENKSTGDSPEGAAMHKDSSKEVTDEKSDSDPENSEEPEQTAEKNQGMLRSAYNWGINCIHHTIAYYLAPSGTEIVEKEPDLDSIKAPQVFRIFLDKILDKSFQNQGLINTIHFQGSQPLMNSIKKQPFVKESIENIDIDDLYVFILKSIYAKDKNLLGQPKEERIEFLQKELKEDIKCANQQIDIWKIKSFMKQNDNKESDEEESDEAVKDSIVDEYEQLLDRVQNLMNTVCSYFYSATPTRDIEVKVSFDDYEPSSIFVTFIRRILNENFKEQDLINRIDFKESQNFIECIKNKPFMEKSIENIDIDDTYTFILKLMYEREENSKDQITEEKIDLLEEAIEKDIQYANKQIEAWNVTHGIEQSDEVIEEQSEIDIDIVDQSDKTKENDKKRLLQTIFDNTIVPYLASTNETDVESKSEEETETLNFNDIEVPLSFKIFLYRILSESFKEKDSINTIDFEERKPFIELIKSQNFMQESIESIDINNAYSLILSSMYEKEESSLNLTKEKKIEFFQKKIDNDTKFMNQKIESWLLSLNKDHHTQESSENNDDLSDVVIMELVEENTEFDHFNSHQKTKNILKNCGIILIVLVIVFLVIDYFSKGKEEEKLTIKENQ